MHSLWSVLQSSLLHFNDTQHTRVVEGHADNSNYQRTSLFVCQGKFFSLVSRFLSVGLNFLNIELQEEEGVQEVFCLCSLRVIKGATKLYLLAFRLYGNKEIIYCLLTKQSLLSLRRLSHRAVLCLCEQPDVSGPDHRHRVHKDPVLCHSGAGMGSPL